MYFNPRTFKSILFVGAIIGMCQSVMWLVVTICAILTFRCAFHTPQYGTDQIIWTTIVKLYFEGDECRVEGDPPGYPGISEASVTKPIEIFSFMISFLIVSCSQFVSSAFLLRCRNGKKIWFILKEWCFITFIIAIMDAVLAGIFLYDYIEFQHLKRDEEDGDDIAASPAAMFVVAARGVALWIINIAFVVYFSVWLSCTSHQMESSGKEEEERRIGRENPEFKDSPYFFVFRDGKENDSVTHDDNGKMSLHEVRQHQRSVSVSSIEAVTPFNEEERAKTTVGVYNCFGRSNIYHSHGCPALRSELEQKLAAMRGKEEGIIHKAIKLEDFSHNIRNFKHGGRQS